MKNTRYHDIAKIEEDMAKGVVSKDKGYKMIDMLHRQTKDSNLEDKRKRLIEKQRKYDREYDSIRKNPEKMNEKELARYIRYFQENPNEF